MDELTDRDREILRLAGARFRYESNRLEAARERFGLREIAYLATVNRLLDEPAAAVAEPQTVARLRRLRDAQRHQRRAS